MCEFVVGNFADDVIFDNISRVGQSFIGSFMVLIISRTPVRISFFGGGTDYRPYYEEWGGAVLGTTIDQYTYISVKTLQSAFFDHTIRVAYSRTELVNAIDQIQHPSVREGLKFLGIDGNLDIHIFSDLPARTGLGSSSSFTVGFLNALYALQGKCMTKQTLAEQACHVEQTLICENVGSQDQFHAAFGGLNVIEFTPAHIQVRPLVISAGKRIELEQHLMLFFTGLTRHASEIVQEQLEKTKARAHDGVLKQMHESVYEAERIVMESPVIAQELGALLHENWEMKKKLSSKISNDVIDQAYTTALRAGAYGGKLCGAGNGGFLALLVPLERQQTVREALRPLNEVKCRFDHTGSSIIYMKE